jgi:hypothetical protein
MRDRVCEVREVESIAEDKAEVESHGKGKRYFIAGDGASFFKIPRLRPLILLTRVV